MTETKLVVEQTYKLKGIGNIAVCKVETGIIKDGDEMMFPWGLGRVSFLETFIRCQIMKASQGESCTLVITNLMNPGDVILK